MFTVKYGYTSPSGGMFYEVKSADHVVEHFHEGKYSVTLLNYPTKIGHGGSTTEDVVRMGGDGQPFVVFVENLAGKTVHVVRSGK